MGNTTNKNNRGEPHKHWHWKEVDERARDVHNTHRMTPIDCHAVCTASTLLLAMERSTLNVG